MNKGKQKLQEARQKCIDAKVGDTIICPSCGTEHIKKTYQSVFCKSKGGRKCNDNFWNNVDPKKRNNTTRISPASARYMAQREEWREERGMEDYDPGDSEYWDSKDY